jgi:transposase
MHSYYEEIKLKNNLILKPTNKPMIDEYVNSYNSMTKKTVFCTIELAKIVQEVSTKRKGLLIEETDYQYFLKSINLPSDSSQFRKMICIANRSDRIEKYIDNFPSATSVIYQLTSLDADKFDYLINQKLLSKDLTINKIKDILAPIFPATKKTVPTNYAPECSIKITFNDDLLDNLTSSEVEKKLRDLLDFIRSKNDAFMLTSLFINNNCVRRL